MDFLEYKFKFVDKAQVAGYSSEIIDKCLNYAQPLIDRGLPIIYNHEHLASLVGFKNSYLLRASIHTEYFYREFTIQKKNKGSRTIAEPLPGLKEIQDWILNEVLYKVAISKFSKAYLPKTTIKQNLVFHRNMPKVLTLDIENFFGTIHRDSVRKLFISMGYSLTLSNLLSKICTLKNYLPQGAPTSPYISNLYLSAFDDKIGQYCTDRKIRYTRYADDLTFSGDFDAKEVELLVKGELDTLDLKLNKNKTLLMKKGERQIVTGVVVNEKLQVERKKRKEIRQVIYFIKKFGLQSHLQKLNIAKSNYLEHLLGKINFILFINSGDKEFAEYKRYIIELKSDLEKL